MAGERAARLTTCGGDAAGNANMPEEAFRRLMEHLQSQPGGIYVLENCSRPSGLRPPCKALAHRMARELLV